MSCLQSIYFIFFVRKIMDVKQRVIELTTKLSETNYDSEDDHFTNDCVLEIAKGVNSYDDEDTTDLPIRRLRDDCHDLLENKAYQGTTVSRRKASFISKDSSDNDQNDIDVEENNNTESETDNEEIEEEEGEDEDKENGEDEEVTSGSEQSEYDNEDIKKGKETTENCNIYSEATKNVKEDIGKGMSIRNQLGLWETFLECRIKLQKSLIGANKLPQKSNFDLLKMKCDPESQAKITKCNKNLFTLMGKLSQLQVELLKKCPEYSKGAKTNNGNISDEEIPSSGSEMDEEAAEEIQKPIKKKRKLDEYSEILNDQYKKYIPYRNSAIQKWNDKTRVASGKMANSNFSAFEQSTLKQIEQIMCDKSRLINRTQTKRSSYRVLGTADENQNEENKLDTEIFDDDDFYHKLLRDYIEKKSVDSANSNQVERQWIELQKLRSKMKKNVDTKSSKGRKLRYAVHPKLVNFMAPIQGNIWSEKAQTDLYNSLFGKIKLQ